MDNKSNNIFGTLFLGSILMLFIGISIMLFVETNNAKATNHHPGQVCELFSGEVVQLQHHGWTSSFSYWSVLTSDGFTIDQIRDSTLSNCR